MQTKCFSQLRVAHLRCRIGLWAAGLALLGLPVFGQAQYRYITNNEGTITITAYFGSGGSVTIPSTIDGHLVTAIGDRAFSYYTVLTSVTIPDSVTSIGYGTFFGCTGLTSVLIGGSVTNIGLPVEPNPFAGCSSLTNFSVAPLNPAYSSLDGVLLNQTKDRLLIYPAGKSGSYTVPDSVTSIGKWAFFECAKLTNIMIPDSVTNIEVEAFQECTGLTGVKLPSVITSIGEGMFLDCVGLTNVSIPDRVTSIGVGAFQECSGLTGVTIPNSVTSIDGEAFVGCTSLASVTFNDGLTNIGEGAFSGCSSLKEVTIPNSVTYIGDNAFAACTGLTSATIPESVTVMGGDIFWGCYGLTTVNLGNSVIGDGAFNGCTGLRSVIFPDNLTSIGNGAFLDCIGLTSLNIPDSVTNVGLAAFYGCTSLVSVTIGGGLTDLWGFANPHSGADIFDGYPILTNITASALNPAYSSLDGVLFTKNQDKLIKYPDGKEGGYVVPNSVNTIGYNAFNLCTGLMRLAIPNSVTNVEGNAFYSCANLETVTFGPGVALDESFVQFTYCAALRSVFFLGDAPSGVGWLEGDTNVTVYYLPGTSGWGSAFGGAPAVLWNPRIQIGGGSTGVPQSGFGFNIAGTPDIPLVVEATANLTSGAWVPLQSLTLTNGLVSFRDPAWTNYPARFYRIRSP